MSENRRVESGLSTFKELVVVSGKGGTGKSSLAVSFASRARSAFIADCDVDASDLHLVLRHIRETWKNLLYKE